MVHADTARTRAALSARIHADATRPRHADAAQIMQRLLQPESGRGSGPMVRVSIADGRVFEGRMACVDQGTLVLGPAVVECSFIDGVGQERRVFEDGRRGRFGDGRTVRLAGKKKQIFFQDDHVSGAFTRNMARHPSPWKNICFFFPANRGWI